MTDNELLEIAKTSPALTYQSESKGQFAYPPSYRGRVPLKVKMATDVTSDMPFGDPNLKTEKDKEYFVYVNSYGAVSAILSDGKRLGLRPQEFDVIEWHEENQATESDNQGDRKI